MKKTLLLGVMLLAGLHANAQEGGLPDGTPAPDFTVTDLNNVEHHLQDYLDQGKTVILYISATWCGPCWSFHNTHYLEELYGAYGPDGSDEIQVIYVEGDPNTTVDNMYGLGSSNATLGNWVEGTTYPMVNSSAIANSYEIDFFPTIYRICPETGTTTQIERGTPAQLVTSIEGDCHSLNGIPNAAKVTSQDNRFCEETGSPKALLTNRGADITSVTAQLKEDGTVIATKTFEVELGAFEQEYIEFDEMALNGEANYQVELTAVNGATPYAGFTEGLVTEEFAAVPNASMESYNNILVIVHTDQYPGEMSWRIINSAGEVAASHDYSSGASHVNSTKYHNLVLPGNECYSVQLLDDYGDGWTWGNAQHGMTIKSGGEVLFTNDGDIGAGRLFEATFHTNGVLETQEFVSSVFSIYPNPSTGIFNIRTEEAVDVTVIDVTGKTVHTAKGINDGEAINLGGLQIGMYIAKITAANGAERIEKLVIK